MRSSMILSAARSASCFALFTMAYLSSCSPALAAENAGAASPVNTPDAASSTAVSNADSAVSQKVLQAGVKKAVLTTGREIREMGVAMGQLNHAATELYGEMTRQDTVDLAGPDVIGSMVIPAIPIGPIGVGAYLPPRKNWVDYCMSHLSQLMPLVKTEIDDVTPALPDGESTRVGSSLNEITSIFQDVQAHYSKLQTLTTGPAYDNVAIANETAAISVDMKKLDKLRKSLWKQISKGAS